MIAQELIGCRIVEADGTDKIIGKIIGSHNKLSSHHEGGSSSVLELVILTLKREIVNIRYSYIKIHPDDFNKVYNTLKPTPIGSRSEILDIRDEI